MYEIEAHFCLLLVISAVLWTDMTPRGVPSQQTKHYRQCDDSTSWETNADLQRNAKSASYTVAATELPITRLIYLGISRNTKQNIKYMALLLNEKLVWSSKGLYSLRKAAVSENTRLLWSPRAPTPRLNRAFPYLILCVDLSMSNNKQLMTDQFSISIFLKYSLLNKIILSLIKIYWKKKQKQPTDPGTRKATKMSRDIRSAS